jgi:hypothetical protein
MYFARLRDELSKCDGVERVEANPRTASVLIHHRSTTEAIAQFAQAAKLFALALEEASESPSSLASRVVAKVGKLNKRLASASNGTLDLTSISALGLAVGGVIKGIACKEFLPSGSNMIWWAATLLARDEAQRQGTAMPSSPPPAVRATRPALRRHIRRAQH